MLDEMIKALGLGEKDEAILLEEYGKEKEGFAKEREQLEKRISDMRDERLLSSLKKEGLIEGAEEFALSRIRSAEDPDVGLREFVCHNPALFPKKKPEKDMSTLPVFSRRPEYGDEEKPGMEPGLGLFRKR